MKKLMISIVIVAVLVFAIIAIHEISKTDWEHYSTAGDSIALESSQSIITSIIRSKDGVVMQWSTMPDRIGPALGCIWSCKFFWNNLDDGIQYKLPEDGGIEIRYDPDIWKLERDISPGHRLIICF